MTISAFLQKWISDEGTVCLKDKNRLNGYLADYFPEATRERNAIRVAMNLGCGYQFYKIFQEKDFDIQTIKLNQLRSQLLNDAWMSSDAVDFVLDTFLQACNLKLDDFESVQKQEQEVRGYGRIQELEQENDLLKERIKYLEIDYAKLRQEYYNALQQTKASVDTYVNNYRTVEVIDMDLLLEQNAKSLYDMACRLYDSQGALEDIILILKTAAERNHVRSQLKLASIYESRNALSDAFFWYSVAANNKNKEAAMKLTDMYIVSGDYKAASEWCSMAARDGNPAAQYRYGVMLESGQGVLANKQLALQWYRRSAEQGNVDAKLRHDWLKKKLNEL